MSGSNSGGINVAISDRIATVSLTNPARHNAMSLSMWRDLRSAAERLAEDDDVRVVIVRGAGVNAFSAGADISEFPRERTSATTNEMYTEAYVGAQRAIAAIPKPVVAMLRGICAGGGAGIALSCPIRFADRALRFSIPAGRLGVVYDEYSVSQLVAAVGASRALDVLVSGRTIGADEAERIGLVNAILPEDALEAETFAYAHRVAAGAPLSIRAAAIAVQLSLDPADDGRRHALEELERRAAESADYQEGIRAFLEKRPPIFSAANGPRTD